MNAIASHLDSFNPNNLNGELDIFVQEIEPSKDKTFGLESLGIKNIGRVYRNLSVAELIEHILARKEGTLAANGALCVKTGKYTGRSPKDKFIVEEAEILDEVDWNAINVALDHDKFEQLYKRMLAYIQSRDLYIFDGYVGADPTYRLGVRVINEFAWHNLFVHQLFLRPTERELKYHRP
ncbi:MAG TPA: phosphoenolpyruvate carboxykinase (ATP), partial [Cyanobacteria bacterium UBA11372]|nr:phosphoenolpyruvate carboxykinase (ATP) [Cyanobacteria bacterium UBA11372]